MSVQAVRNGMGDNKLREGIVLRPLLELTKNNGGRIISKHKGEAFQETMKPRAVVPEDKMKVLSDANDIALEWVTPMRLRHVLDAFPNADITQTGKIIAAMCEDVNREADKEIVSSQVVDRAISKRTALLFKQYLQEKLHATSASPQGHQEGP